MRQNIQMHKFICPTNDHRMFHSSTSHSFRDGHEKNLKRLLFGKSGSITLSIHTDCALKAHVYKFTCRQSFIESSTALSVIDLESGDGRDSSPKKLFLVFREQ